MTNPSRALSTDAPARPLSAGKLLDLVLATIANGAVAASWAVTAASVMSGLAIPRRILMNSEWALDFGHVLPPPWVAVIGVVAILVSHRFFRWAMSRYTGGRPAFGAGTTAWLGVLAGVAVGAYAWIPPVQVGAKVGPAAGEATRWGVPAYAAYYARLALPALVALVTAVWFLFGRRTPLRAFFAARRAARRRKANRTPRRARAAAAS